MNLPNAPYHDDFFVAILNAIELNAEFRQAVARELTAAYMGASPAERGELLEGALVLVDHHVAGRGVAMESP